MQAVQRDAEQLARAQAPCTGDGCAVWHTTCAGPAAAMSVLQPVCLHPAQIQNLISENLRAGSLLKCSPGTKRPGKKPRHEGVSSHLEVRLGRKNMSLLNVSSHIANMK